jgi:hypothetical protein
MGIMDSAAKVMRGLAAAGQAVVEEAMRAQEQGTTQPSRSSHTNTPPPASHGRAG